MKVTQEKSDEGTDFIYLRHWMVEKTIEYRIERINIQTSSIYLRS